MSTTAQHVNHILAEGPVTTLIVTIIKEVPVLPHEANHILAVRNYAMEHKLGWRFMDDPDAGMHLSITLKGDQ